MMIVYELEEVVADFEYGVSKTYGKHRIDPLFTKLEDAWKAIEHWYKPFLYPPMAERHPKIYIGTLGVTVDCYDDEDFVTETFSMNIIKRNVV